MTGAPAAPFSWPCFVAAAAPTAFFTVPMVPAGLPMPVPASVWWMPVAAAVLPSD
jgi:hypothetical protein